MHTRLLAATLLALSTAPLLAQKGRPEVYTVDQEHSILDFTTRLVGFNRVRGTFGVWQADFLYDPAAPTSGYVRFSANVTSISTQSEDRDRHLKSRDFFEAARVPTLSFDGRVVAATGTRFEVEGRLTIKDSTRTVRFPLELVTPEAADPFGNRRLVFAGKVTLNRRDFGIVGPRFWNQAISDSVSIEMELAGRIWGYKSLGFRRAAYYEPALVAAADSGRFDEVSRRLKAELAAEKDTLRLPAPFDTEVAVGRLVQTGKAREALRTLELFADIAESRWRPQDRSGFHARFGETLIRLGRGAEARMHLDKAVALDSANTNARAWLASIAKAP
ncbi:MAG: hypothetical protein HOP28_15655 [Gemmatimonadales bacterium]|nr:hypothetical protein [Gemmatimonadales bacterium]